MTHLNLHFFVFLGVPCVKLPTPENTKFYLKISTITGNRQHPQIFTKWAEQLLSRAQPHQLPRPQKTQNGRVRYAPILTGPKPSDARSASHPVGVSARAHAKTHPQLKAAPPPLPLPPLKACV